jgi:hypothetical protein
MVDVQAINAKLVGRSENILRRIMTSVDCAVPAFIRVEPAIGSGPVSSQIGQSEISHYLLQFFIGFSAIVTSRVRVCHSGCKTHMAPQRIRHNICPLFL